jgi:hypothetical protein
MTGILRSQRFLLSNYYLALLAEMPKLYATTLVFKATGGSVFVYGNPKQIKETIIGGKIEEKKLNCILICYLNL